jgi:hypothetical protein
VFPIPDVMCGGGLIILDTCKCVKVLKRGGLINSAMSSNIRDLFCGGCIYFVIMFSVRAPFRFIYVPRSTSPVRMLTLTFSHTIYIYSSLHALVDPLAA